jgi:hypothetical protein
MLCATQARALSRSMRVATVNASDVGTEAVGELGLVVASGIGAVAFVGVALCCKFAAVIELVTRIEPAQVGCVLTARSLRLRLLVSLACGQWIEWRGNTNHALATIVHRRPFRIGLISTATRVFDHHLTKANVTNGPICSIVGMLGGGADAVVAVAAAGEQMCTMRKRWLPTMRSSSPVLAERVKRTGHMVAGMPGSYHGRDSSSCQQLPFRGRVEVKSE